MYLDLFGSSSLKNVKHAFNYLKKKKKEEEEEEGETVENSVLEASEHNNFRQVSAL